MTAFCAVFHFPLRSFYFASHLGIISFQDVCCARVWFNGCVRNIAQKKWMPRELQGVEVHEDRVSFGHEGFEGLFGSVHGMPEGC